VNDFAALYAVLLAIVALQRLVELVWSRRNTRASARSRGARAAGTTFDWYAMVAVHALLIVLPALEFFALRRGELADGAIPRWIFWTCTALFVSAQALRYWALGALGRAWNARALVDPNKGVVTRGPYRWIRHPNYLAVLIEFSAIPLAVGAWRAWIVLTLLHTPVLVRRIRAEEALLDAVPGYASAMRGKPRFVPRTSRRVRDSLT
jgi:methyltransferase